jgi:phage virion morphogenesis protein
MSIALQLTIQGDAEVERRLASMQQPDWEKLMTRVGARVERQVRVRITKERSSPDGTPWPEWSARYAESREGGQDLLQDSGALVDGLGYLVQGKSVEVGTNTLYAAHHQFGSEKSSGRGSGIPARPYLGISDANRDELELVIADWLSGLMGR